MEVQGYGPIPFVQHLSWPEVVSEGVGPDLQQFERFQAYKPRSDPPPLAF